MRNMAQTALPFKLESIEELLTTNAGRVLFGEFMAWNWSGGYSKRCLNPGVGAALKRRST